MSKTSDRMVAKKKKSDGDGIVRVIIEALLMVLVIRTFLFQPFTIPSGSMRPTLLVGDYIFVSKYAYGYSQYSLPFWSPKLFSGRIWGGEPKRGDVVVFHPPHNDEYPYYIKRVVGLPGDTVEMRGGALYINGKAVERQKIGETVNVDMIGDIPGRNSDVRGHFFNPAADMPVAVYRETLPNGVSYNTFDIYPMTIGDNTPQFKVEPGYYFMMGDNRDASSDSRFSLGQVPAENLIGRANLIFFSISGDSQAWKIWRWPFDTRWERVFSFVQTPKDVPYD